MTTQSPQQPAKSPAGALISGSVGAKAAPGFWCVQCGNDRPVIGRRLKRVDGVRRMVCKGCAK